ncbi:MAG: hypothetical protein ACMUIA_05060 [bacterium]
MEVLVSALSYEDVSSRIREYWGFSTSFHLIFLTTGVILLFLFSSGCLLNLGAQAQDLTVTIDSFHPDRLVSMDESIIEARGGNLDQISRVVLTQSLPFVRSELQKDMGQIGGVTDLALWDDYIFAITDYSEISIINISDPNCPKVEGRYKEEEFTKFPGVQAVSLIDLCVLDNYLFITDSPYNGLWILNISTPGAPRYITRIPVSSVDSVYVIPPPEGSNLFTIYLTTWQYGLRVYQWPRGNSTFTLRFTVSQNLSNPTNLALKVHVPTQERYVYIVDGISVKVIKEVGQSSSGQFVCSLDESFLQDPNYPPYYSFITDVKVKGEYLYVVDSQYGLYVVDIKMPDQPRMASRLPLASGRVSIEIWNDLAMITAGEYGLDLVDISLSARPAFLHHISTEGTASCVAVEAEEGKYLYIANGYHGFVLVDIQALTSSIPLGGHLPVKGNIWDLVVSGGKAYVSAGSSGLRVADVSDSWDPHFIYSLGAEDLRISPTNPTNVNILDCCLYRNGLYLVNGSSLCAFSKSQDRPSLLRTIREFDVIQSIVIKGDYLYMLKLMEGLKIFRLDSSLIPSSCSNLSLGSSMTNQDLSIENGLAYVASGSQGLWIINVSNPSYPGIVWHDANAFNKLPVFDVRVKEDYAYLLNGNYGITIVDLSVKQDPIKIKRINLEGDYLEKCFLYDNFLYVAGISHGLWILDISAYSNPVLIDSVAIPRGARAVFATQEQIYIAEQCDMIHIYTAPRNLPVLNPDDTNQVLDPGNPDRDPNALWFRVPSGLPIGFYDLIFLNNYGEEKIRKRKAIQIEGHRSITLKAGLNLFGYPGKIPYEYRQSSHFLEAINSAGGKVQSLINREPVMISYWQAEGVAGDLFTIENNHGYLLYVQKEGECSINLRADGYLTEELVLSRIILDLEEKAVHWISFPVREENLFSFNTFQNLENQLDGKRLAGIQRLNALSGKREATYTFFRQHSGQNFLIERGEGYLLYREE